MPGDRTLCRERPGRETSRELSHLLAAWEPPDGHADQLHPGDIGWNLRFEDALVEATQLRWRTDVGEVVAIGLLDAPNVLRLAVDPARLADLPFARLLADHVESVLADGEVFVDGPAPPAVWRVVLAERGWQTDPETWQHLWRPLSPADAATDVPGVAGVSGEADVEARVAVQRAAFSGSTSTVPRWWSMMAGPCYDRDLDLVARDDGGTAVAGATGWLAGPGRCAILEPVGTHRDHQGRGHGSRVIAAACVALARSGASGVAVHTPVSNLGAVAAYGRAGFRPLASVAAMWRRTAS